ncbi:unnamed protein product [Prorocentrum cordatum]|uniref:Uncharacterized protein n=1 Tax=Prorocentrum cordatum TaxID=2364126 RepID=A0ABN9WIW7_9DINO|nr:unnamed protein product [Polarella glacialis]
MDSSLAEDLMTLGVVSGNQYLPGIAAACALAVPCYHTQAEDASGSFLMVYSTSESCEARLLHVALRAPVLALVIAVGPVLWARLLQRRRGEGQDQFLRFLTASYLSVRGGRPIASRRTLSSRVLWLWRQSRTARGCS